MNLKNEIRNSIRYLDSADALKSWELANMTAAFKDCYAVIFSSQRQFDGDGKNYEVVAEKMLNLAKNQKGFLGVESVRDENGFGITISYWKTLDDIGAWKANSEHLEAQYLGRSKWYKSFATRVCRVEREYHFGEKS